MIEASASRIRCPACGTDQDAPRAGHAASCVVCGSSLRPLAKILSGNGGGTGVLDDTPAETFDLADVSPFARATAALPSESEAAGSRPVEIDELREAEKQATSLLAFVPVWGAWKIWQSELHERFEKLRLVVLSLLFVLTLVLALWASWPSREQHLQIEWAKTENQIRTLAGLVREYQRQYGAIPDEDTWQRSANRGDLRFYDLWGRIYLFRKNASGFTIGTYGKGGAAGGSGEEQDFFRTFPNQEGGERRDLPPWQPKQ